MTPAAYLATRRLVVAAGDRLEIDTLAGTDTVDTTGLAAGAIQLFADGVLIP